MRTYASPLFGTLLVFLTSAQVLAQLKGGITYTLASSPDGLKVASDGTLIWTVAEGIRGEEVTVVVTVGDASGEELFHTLKVRVK
jgi:hypothetical protein